MIIPEIQSYSSRYQKDIENLFYLTWHDTDHPLDLDYRHSDLRNIKNVYQVNGGDFWLMRYNDTTIGTVAVRSLEDGVAEVKRLNVLQEYRGNGYGDLLFKHALNYSIQIGFDLVRLDSVKTFLAALHLYEKYGFTEIPRYNDNPKADIFMELNLQETDVDRFA